MSTQELSSIAVHVVGQYNLAGKALVNAYRTSAHRLLNGTAARFSGVQKVTDFLATRLDSDTEQVVSAMDRLATASTNGLETLAARAEQDVVPGAAAVRNMLTALQLPAANVSAQIADKLLEGAQALETRATQAGDIEAAPAPAQAAAKPARRAIRKAA